MDSDSKENKKVELQSHLFSSGSDIRLLGRLAENHFILSLSSWKGYHDIVNVFIL